MTKLLKNKSVLYGVLFLALMNVLGYMNNKNYDAIIIFSLVGFLTQYFSQNMIIILLVPIVFTAVFTLMRRNVREGLVVEGLAGSKVRAATELEVVVEATVFVAEATDSTNYVEAVVLAVPTSTEPEYQLSFSATDPDQDTDSDQDTSFMKPLSEIKMRLPEVSAGRRLGEVADGDGGGGGDDEEMTNLHPKWIKDDTQTEKDFYSNLPEDVDNVGMVEMNKQTKELVKNQKNLRNTMTKMMPIMDQAQNILANIDTGSMKKMMDMADSLTTPFQKSSSK